ncbi:hypothetical protein [Parasitella parasitica]|uniref:5'-nucleotidase domain-containing protein 3 n=1 Tax=Parasitella parasitica TaxID=35722 RepID=A0A0B7N3V8_9FUNG|nr:hypothetical protein [Parasitella parasitica]
MFRKLIVKRGYHRNFTDIADGRRVVELLRKRYQQKKLQHIDAAEKDKATILSMNTLKQRKWDDKASVNAQTEDICGFGFTSPNEIFINNELNLSNIKVYGFDYDANFQFDPDFAIRGLHYDFNNGWLMKIDNMANIQLNTVHGKICILSSYDFIDWFVFMTVGREPINNIEEIMQVHKGRHISPEYLRNNMFQLNDLFSIPQACLLSDVVQYFRDHNMNFHPRYLSDDVSTAARILHTGAHGIGGMSYLTSSDDWRDLFDCVIVSARKPEFYKSHRPFRRVQEPNWDKVNSFEPGEVYQGGNMKDFAKLTGWTGGKVLYFGDHVFSDLVDASMQHGWHTGAIIHELAEEIEIRNQPSYRHTLSWLLQLEKLLNEAQSWRKDFHIDELDSIISEWRGERQQVRIKLKTAFNQSFGSVFRTYQNPSFFANKIRKFADIYMSNVTNLDRIDLDYVFYPNRTYLPHEQKIEEIIDTAGDKMNEFI